MKSIKNLKGNDVIIFTDNLENEAFAQVKNLANFPPYQDSVIRIMPDAHAGKGCTVGTTMTISDKVTPNLVGVDIGCGMLTVKLKDDFIDYKKLDATIKAKVPSGFNIHLNAQKEFDFSGLRCKKHVDVDRASLSIGSLGGGNHFIEVARSEKHGDMYLVVHSGSRKLGADVCKYYQDLAVKNLENPMEKKGKIIKFLKSEGREKEINPAISKMKKSISGKELAYLTGQDFSDYMNDMSIIQKFASLNRHTMADIISKEMDLREDNRFETIHNYIDFKRMILRKGAVSAEKGEKLLIPINMRDGSLLCIGKGNKNWNYSAPHGAGRLMSRSKARQLLNLDDFVSAMQDVYSTSVILGTLDEAPQAYKPMAEIINTISDTAEIIDFLKPVYNFKAH